MEKTMFEKSLMLYGACFFVGLTVGSAAGLGANADQSFYAEIGARQGLAFAFLTNLPFWCCVFMPSKAIHRALCACAALGVKGALTGCASVYIFSSAQNPMAVYARNILPQLLTAAPLLLCAAAVKLLDRPRDYTAPAAAANFVFSAAAAALGALAQFGVSFVFYQFT